MATESLEFQVLLFLNSIYGGLIGGFVYDIYKGSRYIRNPGKVRTFIEDIMFWVLLALLAFYLVMKTSFGYIRGFVFIGFGLGGLMYLKLLSRGIYPIIIDVFRLIKNGIEAIKKLFKPLIKLKRKIGNSYREYKRLKKVSSNKK